MPHRILSRCTTAEFKKQLDEELAMYPSEPILQGMQNYVVWCKKEVIQEQFDPKEGTSVNPNPSQRKRIKQ